MKFIISKTALEMAVKNICRVINPKNALPILADILCMVDEERKTITMTGSDSEAWLTYQVQLQECEGGGPFCIGADLLRDALAELSEQPLTILATTESDNRFTLQHESGTTVLPLELSDEYPTPRRIDSTVNEWTLESGMLKRVLKRSMFATANDDLRPVMNGVYFDQCDGVLNIVATDGHVLIRNAEEVDNLPDSFIMTKKAANLLPTLMDGDDEVVMAFDDRAVRVERGGPFCIGADLLRDALAELSEQPLTILATTESDNRFTLQHESGTTVLPLELSDEYPTPRRIDSTVNEWTLESGMLKRVLKRSMFATANDDLRPVMNGVYFDQCDGVLNIVATDGHVLIRNAEEVDNLPDSFIMTKKAANLLPTLMDGDDEVVMAFDDRAVRVEQGQMSFTFLMVEGKYPNYMSVIPQDAPYSLTADRPALLKALRNVAHFTPGSSRLVKLTMLSNQTMELRGEDFDFSTEATDRISIDYPAGRDMTLGVKADSIIDELSRIIEPRVTIHFTDPSRAVTIAPIDPLYQGEEITMLLMPMLVNED